MTDQQRRPAVYRAETVGSLLRPGWLKAARDQHAQGAIGAAALKAAEDRAVNVAVELQETVGLEVVTDGEMRRAHFTGPLSEAVSGMENVPAEVTAWRGADGDREVGFHHRRAVVGKLCRTRSLAQEEFTYLRAKASSPTKQTLPSPLMMQTFWSKEHSTAAYRDPFEMFADAAGLIRQEIVELAELGCEYVQIDAPELAMMVDESVRENFRGRGVDPDRLLTAGMELLNDAVAVPGPRRALHLCRGNREGQWMSAGGYEAVAGEVFNRATNFDTFFLEYDDERSGGFEPLRQVADGAVVVLGLVTTKRSALEDPGQVLARIEEASSYIPRDQLALSTQCGFASVIGGNPVTLADQRRKLELVREVADRAWPAG